MNLAEQISYEKIRLFELQLCDPNLSQSLAGVINAGMMAETSFFLKDKRHSDFEPEIGSKVYESVKESAIKNSALVWDVDKGKYLRRK